MIGVDDFERLRLDVNGFGFDALAKGPKDGELVLLLHGFPQFADAWVPLMRPLAEAGYRALAVDQRGYSPGARPPKIKHYRTEHLVSDALGFADAVGANTFHLVGHDWGGLLAWQIAAEHSERVHSLTVLSTPHKNAFLDALRTDSDQKWRSKYIPLFRMPGHVAERILQSGKPQRLGIAYQGKVHECSVSENLRRLNEPNALTAALNWYRAIDMKSRIGKVAVPVLYIWGSEDFALGRTAAEKTSAYVTGPYRFEPLKGKSHWLLEEAPEQITALVLEHLAASRDRPRESAIAVSVSKRSDMSPVLLFDLNGTLLDTHALASELRKIFGRKLSLREWFTKVVQYSMAITLAGDYREFGEIAAAVLELEAAALGFKIVKTDVERVRNAMKRLPAFPDVEPALNRLQEAAVRLAVLTNSAPASVEEQVRHAGLEEFFERLISVGAVKRFKPAPETYRAAAQSLNVDVRDIIMVAAHHWDLMGAARAGCRTAFLAREGKTILPGAPQPDFVAENMKDLANQILTITQSRRSSKAVVMSGAAAIALIGTALIGSRYMNRITGSALRDSGFPENRK